MLLLDTMEHNLKFNKKLKKKLDSEFGMNTYPHYDNYDAIEVPFTECIPSDYDGMMGVPITFFDKYNPKQFEICGITKTWFGAASKTYDLQVQISKDGKKTKVSKLNDGPAVRISELLRPSTYYEIEGERFIQTYARVLIRARKGAVR